MGSIFNACFYHRFTIKPVWSYTVQDNHSLFAHGSQGSQVTNICQDYSHFRHQLWLSQRCGCLLQNFFQLLSASPGDSPFHRSFRPV
uniref:Uncharacterized protein n=1 Tax=Anguilla anguilla TaxID=7936 RepID=A0A0E9XFY5_ANGAN